MNTKSRIEKLEQVQKPNGYVFIVLNEGETNEQAYQRHFPDGSLKPRAVLYLTPEDIDI